MYKRGCSLISCDFLCSLMYLKFSFIYYTQTMVESCFDSFCVYKCRQCCTTMYILGTKYTGCSQHPFGDMITKMTKILSLFCIVDNTLPHSSTAYRCRQMPALLHSSSCRALVLAWPPRMPRLGLSGSSKIVIKSGHVQHWLRIGPDRNRRSLCDTSTAHDEKFLF